MNLFTQTMGTGPDLVLLHGWGMNSDVWETLLPKLTPYFRVTLVDLPGHGRSLNSPADYSLPNLANIIAKNLPSKFIVMGWSLGGMIATQIALNFPKQISKLILVASAPQFVRDDSWPEGTNTEVLNGFAEQLKQNYQQSINRFIAIQSMGSDSMREEQRTLRERVFRHGNPQPAALEGGLDILCCANLRPQLPQLHCPTLLIAGENDTLFRRKAAEQTLAIMNNARLSVIKGASHAPFLSHPNHFLAPLTAFLNEQT